MWVVSTTLSDGTLYYVRLYTSRNAKQTRSKWMEGCLRFLAMSDDVIRSKRCVVKVEGKKETIDWYEPNSNSTNAMMDGFFTIAEIWMGGALFGNWMGKIGSSYSALLVRDSSLQLWTFFFLESSPGWSQINSTERCLWWWSCAVEMLS